MNFDLTSDQSKLVAKVSKFAAEEVAPGAEERDKSGEFPHNLWKRMGEVGLLGLLAPEEYSGGGNGFLTTAVAFESFARHGHDMSLSMSLTVTTLLCYLQLLRHANAQQKRTYLPPVISGEKIAAFAVSERKRGSHPRYLETEATHDGSDYVINGRKMYISNGPIADFVIVFAITERLGDKNGITAFIVEKERLGFSIGEIMNLPFCRSAPHCELVFENCRVPEENMLGEKNSAFDKMVRGVRETEDSLGMAMFAGFLGWGLELASAYFKDHKEKATEEKLLLLSDLASIAETAQTIAFKVAWLRDKNREMTNEFTACHIQFQKIVDSGIETLKVLFSTKEELLESGLERPLRDMGIALIGRNVAKIRHLKLAERLIAESGS